MQTQLAEFIRHTPQGREAEEILRKCVHCGFCTATCPTYQVLGDDPDSPRGRIYLMKRALEGARGVIDRDHPHVLLEIHPTMLQARFGGSAEEVVEVFRSRGYRMFALDGHRLEVTELDGRRVARVRVTPLPISGATQQDPPTEG